MIQTPSKKQNPPTSPLSSPEANPPLAEKVDTVRFPPLPKGGQEGFVLGLIEGAIIQPLKKHQDDRGWLTELFRQDELNRDILPVMAYASFTRPGGQRGPHEHTYQADYFCFFGPSTFRIVMWDNRKDSTTYGRKMSERIGEKYPSVVIVPPGVVHTYKNVGSVDGLVINCPNRLYAGNGRKEMVDEIRHETDANTPFRLEEEDR